MRKFIFAIIAAVLITGSPLKAMAVDVGTGGDTVIAPYFQSLGATFYSFIAITNPSTTTAVSRSVTTTAVGYDGTKLGEKTVGVGIGKTVAFFIGGPATGFSSADKHLGLLEVVDGLAVGNVILKGTSNYMGELSIWGSIFYPGSSSGFAMEFIGDFTDTLDNGEQGL